MRGLFSAGVCDVMMEHGLWPDGVVGVSAGAAFGCNMKSRQAGRVIRYNKRFARDGRYSGMGSLLRTGDYFNAEFSYHEVPTKHDIFDTETFAASPMTFTVVATDVLTGKAVYHQIDRVDYNALEWIRASASMPLASRVVNIDGWQLLDGGVADSIPLEYFEKEGFTRNIVILTQPAGYRKNPNKLMPLLRIGLRRYPSMVEALRTRHLMYNAQLDYVSQAEKEGRCVVIRPEAPLPIGHICHDEAQMERAYQLGRAAGEKQIEKIKAFHH